MTVKQVTLPQLLMRFGQVSEPDNGTLRSLAYRRKPFGEPLDEDRLHEYLQVEDFTEGVHQQILAMLARSDVHGMVVFVCQDLWSSSRGLRKGLVFGPGCTYTSLVKTLWYDQERKIYNLLDTELASTQKWPEVFYVKPEFESVELAAEKHYDHCSAT